MTPGFGSSKRVKDSLSMQKILQPYLALDVIRDTKDGYLPNLKANETVRNQDRSAPRLNHNLNNTFNVDRCSANKQNIHLQLEMDAIKEEDNGIFRGLGGNHNKSML